MHDTRFKIRRLSVRLCQEQDIALFATAMPKNKASIRVLEKAGFTFPKYVPENNRNQYTLTKHRE